MAYRNDLRNEKVSGRKTVFEPGWHRWEVTRIDETVSKKGNQMFVVELAEDTLLKTIDIYLLSVEGKAGMLKSFLTAIKAPVDKDGVFEWGFSDILGRSLEAFIENEPSDWVDRQGEMRHDQRSRIVEFRSI